MKKADVIAHVGGVQKLSELLNCDRRAIYQWDDIVPESRQYELEVKTGGALKTEYTLSRLALSTDNDEDKRRHSDNISDLVLAATSIFLEEEDCKAFALKKLLPQLVNANLLSDPEPTSDIDAFKRWEGRVVKRITRVIKGEQLLPAAWVLPWLSALPDFIRERCKNSIAAALGFHPVKIKAFDATRCGARSGIDRLSREFADVISASGPAMDGTYSLSDGREQLQILQNELNELWLEVHAEMMAIAASTGVTPAKFEVGV